MVIRLHGLRYPSEIGVSGVERFPSWLASERRVSAATHKQELSALLFFYGGAGIGKPQLSRQHPADHLPPKPAAAKPFPLPTPRPPSAPSNCPLRASTCASSVKQFLLAREHLRLAITPCRCDGDARRLGGRRDGPCGRAGRACGQGFLARSQGVFACKRC